MNFETLNFITIRKYSRCHKEVSKKGDKLLAKPASPWLILLCLLRLHFIFVRFPFCIKRESESSEFMLLAGYLPSRMRPWQSCSQDRALRACRSMAWQSRSPACHRCR